MSVCQLTYLRNCASKFSVAVARCSSDGTAVLQFCGRWHVFRYWCILPHMWHETVWSEVCYVDCVTFDQSASFDRLTFVNHHLSADAALVNLQPCVMKLCAVQRRLRTRCRTVSRCAVLCGLVHWPRVSCCMLTSTSTLLSCVPTNQPEHCLTQLSTGLPNNCRLLHWCCDVFA